MIILENVLHGSPCRKSQKFVGDFLKLSYILRIKKKNLKVHHDLLRFLMVSS